MMATRGTIASCRSNDIGSGPSPQPSPIRWERENRRQSIGIGRVIGNGRRWGYAASCIRGERREAGRSCGVAYLTRHRCIRPPVCRQGTLRRDRSVKGGPLPKGAAFRNDCSGGHRPPLQQYGGVWARLTQVLPVDDHSTGCEPSSPTNRPPGQDSHWCRARRHQARCARFVHRQFA